MSTMSGYLFKFKDTKEETKQYFLDSIVTWWKDNRAGDPSEVWINRHMSQFDSGEYYYIRPIDSFSDNLKTLNCWESITPIYKIQEPKAIILEEGKFPKEYI